MIRKLDIFILRSFFRSFLAGFAIVLFILTMEFVARYKDDLFGKGLGAVVIFKVFLYACTHLVVTALPIAILLSSLMTMGNLGEQYELAAIKAAGISLYRTIRPLVMVSIFFALFSFWFSVDVIPGANLKLFALLFDVQQAKPAFRLEPGKFYHEIDNYVIRIGSKSDENDMLYDVLIYDHTDARGNTDIIHADSARMISKSGSKHLQMLLFHGNRHEMMVSAKGKSFLPYGRLYFDSLKYTFDLSGFGLNRTPEQAFSSHQYMLNLAQLRYAADSISRNCDTLVNEIRKSGQPFLRLDSSTLDGPRINSLKVTQDVLSVFPKDRQKLIATTASANMGSFKSYVQFTRDRLMEEIVTLRKYQYQYHQKYSLPVACMVFIMIGAPLGAIIRKGGIGMPALISILFFIVFYSMNTYGTRFAREGVLEPWAGAWLPNLVLLPVAILCVYQSATDSRLFDSSWYGMLFRRLRNLLSRK